MALIVVAFELALVGGALWLIGRPIERDAAAVSTATLPVAEAGSLRVTPRPAVMAEAVQATPVPPLVATPQATEEATRAAEPPTPVAVTPSPAPAMHRPVVPTPTETAVPTPTETLAPTATSAPPLPQAEVEAASAAGMPAQPAEPPSADLPDDVTDAQVIELTRRINQARAEAGLPALAWCRELALAAQMHAEDMAAHGFVSHTGSDGSEVTDRMRRVGYEPAFRGEIIAWVPGGQELAFAGWWESQAHHATILGEAYRDFGIARVPHPTRAGHNYFVVVFGRRRG